jgi:hypothetical protein
MVKNRQNWSKLGVSKMGQKVVKNSLFRPLKAKTNTPTKLRSKNDFSQKNEQDDIKKNPVAILPQNRCENASKKSVFWVRFKQINEGGKPTPHRGIYYLFPHCFLGPMSPVFIIPKTMRFKLQHAKKNSKNVKKVRKFQNA